METSSLLNRGFSNTETLCSEYKYYCEQCRSKQEAQKRWVKFVAFSRLIGLWLEHSL